jgi:hypothetical protein
MFNFLYMAKFLKFGYLVKILFTKFLDFALKFRYIYLREPAEVRLHILNNGLILLCFVSRFYPIIYRAKRDI